MHINKIHAICGKSDQHFILTKYYYENIRNNNFSSILYIYTTNTITIY